MPTISPAFAQKTAAALSALIIISFFTGEFFYVLASIGIYGLFALASVYKSLGGEGLSGKQYKLSFISLAGVFLLHLASGLNTQIDHQEAFWMDVVLKLPFLILPLSFIWLPQWPTKYIHNLYLLFFCCVVLSAFGSTVYYLLNKDEINKLYSQSQIMPTVPEYIRFSLMVVLAIVIGIFLISHSLINKYKGVYLLVAIVFLILYLYILAVRSGIGAFNGLGILIVGWLVIKQQRYKQAVLISVILLALPVLSFYIFPTFRNKYYNTQYDVAQVQAPSSANNLSLVGRYYSYKVGLELVRMNPWFGVGKADMEHEISAFYKRDYPTIDPSSYLMPHNQFLYYWVSFGCIGLFMFVLCFYYPLYSTWSSMPLILIAHYVIISLSFIAEFTLDQKSQIGAIYSLFFIALGLLDINHKKSVVIV